MRVVAIPNRTYSPSADELAAADLVVESLAQLTPELIRDYPP
jgi:hypothetical protein